MKTFWLKLAYPLTFCALVVSIVLQAVWLQQLFRAQTSLVRSQLEHEIGEAAKKTIYSSLSEKNKKVEQFFMSEEWSQLRQAFDNMKINNVSNVFNYGIDADSSFVEIKFSFKNNALPNTTKRGAPKAKKRKASPGNSDTVAVVYMHQEVARRLHTLGVRSPYYYVLYDYDNGSIVVSDLTFKPIIAPDYSSKVYSFNLKHLHKYQVIIPDITGVVWYRMRYYILSSITMILLTGAAFFFILRLLRKQKLYNDARISFINNMTHELKTPLSAVLVALESIVKYQLDKEPEKLLSYIVMSQAELQKLNYMIEKVLDINVTLEGSKTSAYQLLDIQDLVGTVLKSMQVRLLAAGTSLVVRPATEPYFVYGHPGHLESVFYNLFDNALKYCAPLASLRIGFALDDGWVSITVADSGPGIEPLYQDRVFDRFFRIPGPGFTHNVRGSGLGLHSVKQTILEHGGTIQLSSVVGQGTIFTIKLKNADEDSIC